MLERLLHALIGSKNESADDVLVEALRLGSPEEKVPVFRAILLRKTVRSLCGIIERFDNLPEPLQQQVLKEIKIFHPALREAGRSDNHPLRLAALKLIAMGHQGKLAYILSENLHNSNEVLSKSATEAMVALARWVATETRRLQRGAHLQPPAQVEPDANRSSQAPDRVNPLSESATVAGINASIANAESEPQPAEVLADYSELVAQRPEIEAAVARAMDVYRGRYGQDVLRAALLLADTPASKTLHILQTAKHGGQSAMVRRLQQPPSSEHIEAFLMGASHGQLRSHFGVVFSHIDEAPVLDALLRKTHWLKDNQLQLCMHQVSRGTWLEPASLLRDADRRLPIDAARIGEWLSTSGIHDVVQDERMEKLLKHAGESFDGRLRLLRIAARRKRGASVNLLKAFLSDSDERLVRMAAREIIRRRPPEFENILLQLMTNAPESVRRVISRTIGQQGFEQFWNRFDQLDKPTRKQAGKAMLKLLPDAISQLKRRLSAGAPEQKIKAMQIAQELEIAENLREQLVALCSDGNPRIRSKAVALAGEISAVPAETIVERIVSDPDARVRANAIEVIEQRPEAKVVPVLALRARSNNNRERANAIKVLLRMRVGAASVQLLHMLRDPRPDHRVSALWALRQSGWWHLLNEVGRLAKQDENLRVRRFALGILKNVAETARAKNQKEAG
ncbi:MAG TPA: HEAT repeat domain-containing protein [Tepidisphaeraceae bacterium]|nr:HEAT repeat domain-containing protein [Tepidisphaeraceae bacterium]